MTIPLWLQAAASAEGAGRGGADVTSLDYLAALAFWLPFAIAAIRAGDEDRS
jgi:hypothetical protein